jgi:hypothetical protein
MGISERDAGIAITSRSPRQALKEEQMSVKTRTWRTPTYEEIAMNAEIGSYQDDFDRPGDEGPDVIEAETPGGDE